MPRILVVEDEPTIALGLQDDLRLEGFDVDSVTDGATAFERAATGQYDLVLLDVMLPRKDGFTVCRELRQAHVRTPIVLLTAKGQEIDKVLGLELGADDYVTKPFSPRELLARIKAVLRRVEHPAAKATRVHTSDGLQIDFGRCEANRKGVAIDLTPLEFKMLSAFLAHRGQVVAHDQLIREAWGPDVFLTDRVIYTHINNLRRKIESDPSNPTLIVGVRGIGYRFDG